MPAHVSSPKAHWPAETFPVTYRIVASHGTYAKCPVARAAYGTQVPWVARTAQLVTLQAACVLPRGCECLTVSEEVYAAWGYVGGGTERGPEN